MAPCDVELLQVAEEFRGDIASECVESISRAVAECENEQRMIDRQHGEFLAGAQSAETAINKQTKEIKQVIRRPTDAAAV